MAAELSAMSLALEWAREVLLATGAVDEEDGVPAGACQSCLVGGGVRLCSGSHMLARLYDRGCDLRGCF